MTIRDDYLGLRLSAAEKQAVQEQADEEKRSASDMARLLISEALAARSLGRQPMLVPKRGGYSGSTEHRLGHAYDPGPSGRCKAKDCGRGRMDH